MVEIALNVGRERKSREEDLYIIRYPSSQLGVFEEGGNDEQTTAVVLVVLMVIGRVRLHAGPNCTCQGPP